MDPLDKALVNAVHALANKKLQAAANTIRQAANSNGAKKQALINNLTKQLAEAQKAAQAAQKVAPGKNASVQTVSTAATATNAVNNMVKQILSWNSSKTRKTFDPTTFRTSTTYTTSNGISKKKINNAITQYTSRTMGTNSSLAATSSTGSS